MIFYTIVALTVDVGILCATNLLIMPYRSVKFHQIRFSSCCVIAETRFVTNGRIDGRTDGRCDFNMSPEVPSRP